MAVSVATSVTNHVFAVIGRPHPCKAWLQEFFLQEGELQLCKLSIGGLLDTVGSHTS